MKIQLKQMGLSYDWNRELATCDPDYYKFEQKMFLDFYKLGIAYKKETWVNWDPVEQTVLANEQVVDGCGWRSGAQVEKKKMNGWFLKISAFANDLLNEIDNLTSLVWKCLDQAEKKMEENGLLRVGNRRSK